MSPVDVTVKAQAYRQGSRTAYVLTPTIGEMLQIIPERANPDVIQDANRRLYTPHGKGFGDYLMANDETWISGALMAGVTEDAVEYDEKAGTITVHVDDLHLNVKLFDGQHRRYGFEYALRSAQSQVESLTARLPASNEPDELKEQIEEWEKWAEVLMSRDSVPLLLYVEEDLLALQQMYADISHVRVPDPITVARFDKRDPFNAAALELAATHDALKDRVDMERNTLGQKSGSLITLNQLASVLRILYSGISGRVSKTEDYDPAAIRERGDAFFNDLASANETFQSVIEGKASPSEVRERGDLSLNVTILKIEAAVWRELTVVREEPNEVVAEYLGELPTEPSADPENIYVKAGLIPATTERKVTPMGRAQESRKAVALAVAGYEEHVIATQAA
jgi:hypothetical protein